MDILLVTVDMVGRATGAQQDRFDLFRGIATEKALAKEENNPGGMPAQVFEQGRQGLPGECSHDRLSALTKG